MTDNLEVRITVNGQQYSRSVPVRKLLLDFLRDDLGLTGTHAGCEHGVCGACTVIFNGEAVRSCLMLAIQASGSLVETVEGLAGPGDLHPLQKAFREQHALQCGYCTPGFLMSAVAMVRQYDRLDPERVRDLLGGNLCRCTGYEGIVQAVWQFARDCGKAELSDD